MLFPRVGVIDLPFQGDETETRDLLGGTKENVVYPSKGVIDLPSRQINDFFYKNETEKD